MTSLLIPETKGRSLEDLAGEEHVERDGERGRSWYHKLWSRLGGTRGEKDEVDEEGDSGPSVYSTLPKINGSHGMFDDDAIRPGIPETTGERDPMRMVQESAALSARNRGL